MIQADVIRYIKDRSLDWKPILGYEGLYDISPKGTIWSFKQNKLLASNRNIVLSKRVKGVIKLKTFMVSRLVANHFLPNPDKYKCIRFIDGNHDNVQLSNLKWDVRHNDKLTSLDVVQLRRLFKQYNGTVRGFQKTHYPGLSITLVGKLVRDLVNQYGEIPVDTELEQWKLIPATYKHHHYYISNLGRVYNVLRKIMIRTCSNGRNLIFTYRTVNKKTKVVSKKTFLVHMLVGHNFLNGYKKKEHDLIFKDGNHLNTQLSNLDFQSKKLRSANLRPLMLVPAPI